MKPAPLPSCVPPVVGSRRGRVALWACRSVRPPVPCRVSLRSCGFLARLPPGVSLFRGVAGCRRRVAAVVFAPFRAGSWFPFRSRRRRPRPSVAGAPRGAWPPCSPLVPPLLRGCAVSSSRFVAVARRRSRLLLRRRALFAGFLPLLRSLAAGLMASLAGVACCCAAGKKFALLGLSPRCRSSGVRSVAGAFPFPRRRLRGGGRDSLVVAGCPRRSARWFLASSLRYWPLAVRWPSVARVALMRSFVPLRRRRWCSLFLALRVPPSPPGLCGWSAPWRRRSRLRAGGLSRRLVRLACCRHRCRLPAFCGLGSRSWASATAFAAGLNLPVILFPCGFSALPPWGDWRPAAAWHWASGFRLVV